MGRQALSSDRCAAMSHQQIKKLGRATALWALVAFLSGCSVVSKNTRPVPGASRNLSCLIEYRPSPTDSTKPDLLFLATAWPYKVEEAYMNPVDVLFHAMFAPGRHLSTPVRVVGATCEPPIWGKGHRIPQLVRPRGGLLCKRNELERVVIEAETKHGQCRVEIPPGEDAPICKEWLGELGAEIQRILDEPCRTPHNQSLQWTPTRGNAAPR
ncbi:MAG: hypothetical protein GY767_00095 [Shimia sp.]|nr:hypothetical protein [Shimia sp.]